MGETLDRVEKALAEKPSFQESVVGGDEMALALIDRLHGIVRALAVDIDELRAAKTGNAQN